MQQNPHHRARRQALRVLRPLLTILLTAQVAITAILVFTSMTFCASNRNQKSAAKAEVERTLNKAHSEITENALRKGGQAISDHRTADGNAYMTFLVNRYNVESLPEILSKQHQRLLITTTQTLSSEPEYVRAGLDMEYQRPELRPSGQ